jgi:hypothetical protein
LFDLGLKSGDGISETIEKNKAKKEDVNANKPEDIFDITFDKESGNYHYINKEATPEQRKQYEAEFKELIKKR